MHVRNGVKWVRSPAGSHPIHKPAEVGGQAYLAMDLMFMKETSN